MDLDPARVLRPLDDVRDAVEALDTYESSDELARAVGDVRDGVERSLRMLLRADRAAPDALRLSALSPAELPLDRLLSALRDRELVSLDLAGAIHELDRAARRAERGAVEAADADRARRALGLVRTEVRDVATREPLRASAEPVEPVAADGPVLAGPPRPVPPPDRWRKYVVAAVGAAVLLAAIAVALLFLSRDRGDEAAVADFRAGRLEEAEARFRAVVEDDPEQVTARLYLGRIYRRQQRFDAAADELRTAVRLAPRDADVRRELGYLLLDLERPRAAAGQFERAVELDPEESLNWIGLVRALRAAGDPRAERVLERAPAEVRALLTESA